MKRMLVVPAAGLGTRLGGRLPKALTPVAGRPMIDHLLDLYDAYVDACVIVAAPSFADDVARHCEDARLPVTVAVQPRPTGMLDAILIAAEPVRASGAERVWITWCDQIAVSRVTLDAIAAVEEAEPSVAVVLPTIQRVDPYIHFERSDGVLTRVLQRREGDRMPAEGEADIGVFSLSRRSYIEELPDVAGSAERGSATGERNFLPLIPALARRGGAHTVSATDPIESVGINTPEELAYVEAWLSAGKARTE